MSKLEANTIAPSTGTTLTLGESGDTITAGSSVTNDLQNGTTSTWTSTINYSTTLTNTSANATTTVTGNYHKVGKVYYFSLPALTRDTTFSGSDVLVFSFTLPATVNSTVHSRGILGGYKMQGRYNTTDMTSDGQAYWVTSTNSSTMTIEYLQLNSSGTGFIRLNGSGANVKIAGYFIGA